MSFGNIMLIAVLTIAAVESTPDDVVPESEQLTSKALQVACNPTKDGRCGPQFGGTTCDPVNGGLFCSKSSWCGYTDAHKANGQKAYDYRYQCALAPCPGGNSIPPNPTKNGRCGPKFGDTTCNPGYGGDKTKTWLFCSQKSWCGNTDAHKTNGQKAYDYRPPCAICPTQKPTNDGRCGPKNGDKTCNPNREDIRVSPQFWWLQETWLFCGEHGWCGNSDYHKTKSQKAYDYCDNNQFIMN